MRASFPQKPVAEIDEPQDPNPVSENQKAIRAVRVDSSEEHEKQLDQSPARKEVGTESSDGQDIRKLTEQHHEDSLDEPEELPDQHSTEEEVSGTLNIRHYIEQHRQRNRFPNPLRRAMTRTHND